jgi:Dyp-type peroxidase family
MIRLRSSKHLEGVSDLTLSAPIRPGFIDAFESVTYETRLRLIMKALFKIRSTAREHSLIKPFVDTAERIQALLDFRLAIIEDTEPRRLLLSATFDRPFEPYMRLIWDPLGPLLDVIFCNCEGYVTATEHGFPDYLAWVRESQIDSNFFYGANGISVNDIQYLLKIERLQREGGHRYSPSAVTGDNPEAIARKVREREPEKTNRLGLQALVGLYKLTDFYPADRPEEDGKYLRWATQHLLAGWGRSDLGRLAELVPEQLAWFEQPRLPARTLCSATRIDYRPKQIQGGIVDSYGSDERPVVHGALLLMRILDARKARAFIGGLPIQAEGAAAPADDIFLNLAFTRAGLENIGVAGAEIDRFPHEFREGMDERAGLLGDVRANHPRRWNLPERNWPARAAGDPARVRVEIPEIDLIVQLRTTRSHESEYEVGDDTHPLHERILALAANPGESGVQLLSVEAMRRADFGPEGRDHFGFVDGISQPKPVGGTPSRINDEVPRGDILLGYPNSSNDCPQPASAILDNGTFLVIRKLSQDRRALDAFLKEKVALLGPPITEELLLGKMMGRDRDGRPLAVRGASAKFNKFEYSRDKRGSGCPFQAHIRRTNPRDRKEDNNGRPTPRLLRRGLSYGPPYKESEPRSVQRGIFFMAYNASIAEQFEVIQRWVNGGNSTGVASWQSDPLMGVGGEEGDRRTFRFVHRRKTYRVDVPDPFIALQWGVYLFVPSMAAIRAIVEAPQDLEQAREAAETRQAEKGRKIIARLLEQAAGGPDGRRIAAVGWKTCLEDFTSKDPGEQGDGPAVWAAIRLHHGGALRVPYGIVEEGETPRDAVLVASKELVMKVFRDPNGHYSMRGQMERMKQSFGAIFLGLDESAVYHAKADAVNDAILRIDERTAFKVARMVAKEWRSKVFAVFEDKYGERSGELDLRRDFITAVLAGVCNAWFGIPDNLPRGAEAGKANDVCDPNHVDAGGWGWASPGSGPGERKPRCPGDYMATSRYCFYPDPTARVQAYGKEHGKALRAGVRAHFDALRAANWPPKAPLAYIMSRQFPTSDELARTLIGVMTGFLPPTDGSLRWTLYDWLDEKTLWRAQTDLISHPSPDPFTRASEALRPHLARSMQKRPSPDMLWRTATRDHRLGGVDVEADDRVFIGIVSALAEDETAGITDIYPIFGGERHATPRKPEDRDHPLHACPAYKFALGTMMGMLSVLLESGRIEALPSPLLVQLTESLLVPPDPPAPAGNPFQSLLALLAQGGIQPPPPGDRPLPGSIRPDTGGSAQAHEESSESEPIA